MNTNEYATDDVSHIFPPHLLLCLVHFPPVLSRIGFHEVHSTIDQADLTAPTPGAVNESMITTNCMIDLIPLKILKVLINS